MAAAASNMLRLPLSPQRKRVSKSTRHNREVVENKMETRSVTGRAKTRNLARPLAQFRGDLGLNGFDSISEVPVQAALWTKAISIHLMK